MLHQFLPAGSSCSKSKLEGLLAVSISHGLGRAHIYNAACIPFCVAMLAFEKPLPSMIHKRPLPLCIYYCLKMCFCMPDLTCYSSVRHCAIRRRLRHSRLQQLFWEDKQAPSIIHADAVPSGSLCFKDSDTARLHLSGLVKLIFWIDVDLHIHSTASNWVHALDVRVCIDAVEVCVHVVWSAVRGLHQDNVAFVVDGLLHDLHGNIAPHRGSGITNKAQRPC